MAPNHEDLRQMLLRLDGRGYPAYKDLAHVYEFPSFTLYIDHIQGDPFAAPSRLRVRVSQSIARFDASLYTPRSREIALRDFLCRRFARLCQQVASRRGSGRSGLLAMDMPGQEVLERTAVLINAEWVEARFIAGLPAAGRRILGREAAEMLGEDLPAIVEQSLLARNQPQEALTAHVKVAEDADTLRDQLETLGLVAFIADGAILPRRSGVDDRPLEKGAIPFASPASLRVTVELPHAGRVVGMGIPRGVTLIVGGGYHGKSTLLAAIERGVYNHVPGDGREWVVTHAAAVKIRAEDGRRIVGVDISPFISNLPFGVDTHCFSTDNASGSTSQAANIIEALEAGARVLLIDEDTAATNFMIRDHRMQELIAKGKEPITPFIDKVRQLYNDHGVSTILVMGGSGDYFDVADTVIAMDDYRPWDATARAREIARRYAAERKPEGGEHFGSIRQRIPLPDSLDPSKGRREVSLKARGLKTILFGREEIDLSMVEQLVDDSQVRALAQALYYARERYMDGRRSLSEILDFVMADMDEKGLDMLDPRRAGDYARFRRCELAAALNRLRTLQVRQAS